MPKNLDDISKEHARRPRVGLNLRRIDVRIGLTLGGLMVALALALAYVLSFTAEQKILRLSAGNMESLSEQMARELADGMDRFAREAQTESVREIFQVPEGEHAAMRGALDQFRAINPEFAWVSVVDASNGRVIASTQGIFEGGSIRDRPVFAQGLKGAFVGDVHEAVRLGELLPKPANGEPLRFLDVSAPIRDASGRVVRVLAAHIAWQWTAELRERIFGPLRTRRGVEAFLLNTEGKVVLAAGLSTPTGANLAEVAGQVGQPATRLTWSDGRDYLTYVAATAPQGQFPGFGWKVVTRQPFEAAFGPVRSLQWAFFVGAALLGLLAASLAWWVSARLVRPVRRLAEAALRASDGAPLGMLASDESIEDISAVRDVLQKLSNVARIQTVEKESSVRQFAALAHSLPQLVWQADADGQVAYVNKDWFGPVPGQSFAVLDMARHVADEDRETFVRAWENCIATGDNLEVRCRVALGERVGPRWVDFKASLIGVRGEPGSRWIGTVFDVHDMVVDTRNLQQTLLDERHAKGELERLVRTRDQFLRTVSHELRSPLSAISGWAQILLKKSATDPLVLQAATVIGRNAEIQGRLINDLIDMNAMTAGRLVLDRGAVDVGVITHGVVASFLHEAQRKGVGIACVAPPGLIVDGDSKRLTQVVTNLIGNALKFTESGGSVDVRVARSGGRISMQVADTGCGIAPSFLPNVFEGLQQQDSSTTRKKGGLGIGLAISRSLVELHGGSVAATSDGPDQGSTFSMFLPELALEADSRDIQHAVDATGEHRLDGISILLVDDEEDARYVAEVALTTLGAKVHPASSAAAVLRMLSERPYDVLVSDIGMPDMDGIGLISEIRSRFRATPADLPAVALTAFAMEADRQIALAAGFDEYVAKPISLSALGSAVVRASRAIVG